MVRIRIAALMALLSLALFACASTTVIKDREGATFEVTSEKDSVVTFKDGDMEVKVDNRGKPSTFDELLKLYFMQWTQKEDK